MVQPTPQELKTPQVPSPKVGPDNPPRQPFIPISQLTRHRKQLHNSRFQHTPLHRYNLISRVPKQMGTNFRNIAAQQLVA